MFYIYLEPQVLLIEILGTQRQDHLWLIGVGGGGGGGGGGWLPNRKTGSGHQVLNVQVGQSKKLKQ